MAVLGLGRSGLAAVRLLRRLGARVFASEAGSSDRNIRRLLPAGVACEFGGHSRRCLEAETILVSPGIPPSAPILRRARRMRPAPEILTEMELGLRCLAHRPARLICVTGTNGKSTVAAWIHHVLCRRRRCVLAGNIGRPLCETADRFPAGADLILEVSSYQLHYLRSLPSDIALLLNLRPDHLEWHGTFSAYRSAKARIFSLAKPEGFCLLDAEEPESRFFRKFCRGKIRWVGRWPGIIDDGLGFRVSGEAGRPGQRISARPSPPGRHNRRNAMFVALACHLAGLPAPEIEKGISSFRGLPHRLEIAGRKDGVVFWNDSKATNLHSVQAALAAMERPVVLLAGGEGKGEDWRELLPFLPGRVRRIVAYGEERGRIARSLGKAVPVETAKKFSDAFRLAWKQARVAAADLLLSPGCASFDQFRDFEERGEAFRRMARSL